MEIAALVLIGNAILFWMWLRAARIINVGECPVCGQKEKPKC